MFLPADGKRGSGKRVWKTYPVIHEWSGDVELLILDETVLQTSQRSGDPVLKDIIEGCGQYIGLGRNRPRNNGWYGRFIVENFSQQMSFRRPASQRSATLHSTAYRFAPRLSASQLNATFYSEFLHRCAT